MAAKGSLEAIIEVAKKELGTIEGPKDNETKYVHGLRLTSNHGASHSFLGVQCQREFQSSQNLHQQ